MEPVSEAPGQDAVGVRPWTETYRPPRRAPKPRRKGPTRATRFMRGFEIAFTRSPPSTVVSQRQILVDPVHPFGRIVRWTVFDLLTADIEVNRSVYPVDCPNCAGREQNLLSGPPVPGIDHEIPDSPN